MVAYIMGVYLERFSSNPVLALEQGYDLSKLIKQESDWLVEAQPQTAHRYRSLLHATKNVRRIAKQEGMSAFIIREREHKVARGLATIISNQAVVHPNPDIGLISGDDLDYWLSPSADMDSHGVIGAVLVRISASEEQRRHYPHDIPAIAPFKVFATVPEGHPNPPLGLMEDRAGTGLPRTQLHSIGDPVELGVPEGTKDTYDVARKGVVSQVYQASGIVEL